MGGETVVRVIEVTATFLGLLVRWILQIVVALPQVVALGLIVYGVSLYDRRLAIILLGLFLLVMTTPIRPKNRRDK